MRDWVRAYSGLPVPSYNIFQPLTPAGLTEDILADTAAFFASSNTLYTVELVHDRFPDGPDYLDQRHYQSLPPQMAMYLEGPHPHQNIELNGLLQVQRVTNLPNLAAFCTLLHQVFDYDLADMKRFFPVRHLGENLRDTLRHYVAFVDDQPVGTGTLIYADKVASIWNLCTVDEYRLRRVATTLVHHMLTEADEQGYPLKVLYSTPHAYHLFNRFDFEMFTQRQWFLPPGLDYEEW
jgi:ribosomal protein S18 acetylase RimI-like enzyme